MSTETIISVVVLILMVGYGSYAASQNWWKIKRELPFFLQELRSGWKQLLLRTKIAAVTAIFSVVSILFYRIFFSDFIKTIDTILYIMFVASCFIMITGERGNHQARKKSKTIKKDSP